MSKILFAALALAAITLSTSVASAQQYQPIVSVQAVPSAPMICENGICTVDPTAPLVCENGVCTVQACGHLNCKDGVCTIAAPCTCTVEGCTCKDGVQCEACKKAGCTCCQPKAQVVKPVLFEAPAPKPTTKPKAEPSAKSKAFLALLGR